MAHVQIKSKKSGGYTLVVDGVDLSLDVLAQGFKVELPESFEEPAKVHMVVWADPLDVDLPDAVVEALRHAEAG